MMDQTTSDMYKEGSGRLGYARVLVEVDVGKSFLDKVEISYVDDQMNIKRTKWAKPTIVGEVDKRDGLSKKNKSFRCTNYVADKSEFLNIVKDVWKEDVRGCHMYKVVQKLKLLKNPLKIFNWKNKNLFEKIKDPNKD
nr:RNA-directed DNA polymerase, eukaryota, reverse transcriptase zinc-binding domain protein [Tanacetum cinerariifolium]